MLDQVASAQPQAKQQLWEQVIHSMAKTGGAAPSTEDCHGVNPVIKVQKMMLEDDPEN